MQRPDLGQWGGGDQWFEEAQGVSSGVKEKEAVTTLGWGWALDAGISAGCCREKWG